MHLISSPAAVRQLSSSLVMGGNCGYRIEGDRVIVTIDEIANNRDVANISGTLSLELWALSQPWQGGDFNGMAVAATQIGQLSGQHCLRNCHYDLNFFAPLSGSWHLCLMLREWDGAGYVTRDTVNFSTPYTAAIDERPEVEVSRRESSNVITVAFKESSADADAADSRELVPATAVKPSLDKAAQSEAGEKQKKSKQPGKPAGEWDQVLLLVNSASRSVLENIKGVSKKLARTIEDGRPYKSHEELLEIKGMGQKLLDKLAKHSKH